MGFGPDIRHRGELGRTVSGVVAGPADAQGSGIVTIASVEPGRFETRGRVMNSHGYILYGIPDIRFLYDNDVRFLAQF